MSGRFNRRDYVNAIASTHEFTRVELRKFTIKQIRKLFDLVRLTNEKLKRSPDWKKIKGRTKLRTKKDILKGLIGVKEEKKETIIINNKKVNGFSHFSTLEIGVSRATSNLKLDEPFNLTLKSANTNMKKTFNFDNWWHFKNWYDNIVLDKESSSDETLKERTNKKLKLNKSIFEFMTFKVGKFKGGCNSHKDSMKTIKGVNFIYNVYNPTVVRNNCGLKCLKKAGLVFKYSKVRKEFGLTKDEKIKPEKLIEIYNHYNESDKGLSITIGSDIKFTRLGESHNIVLHNEHYYYVEKAVKKKFIANDKVKRGELYWDLETRNTKEFNMIGENRSYILKDTICAIYYRPYKSPFFKKNIFVSNESKSSTRQFLDFLIEQENDNKFYNCVAHNGANFDHYFLLNNLTTEETLETDIQLRGKSIIGLQYHNNLFKDSCCFLTNSLKNLCEAYRIKDKKITSFEYNDRTLTNENICFYKPELSFEEFLELKNKEPEFWNHYLEYCLYDCISLSQIWKEFTKKLNIIIGKMDKKLLKKCNISSCNTIGSLSIKIMKNLIDKKQKKLLEQFMDTDDKYDFVCKFKRGGISHCNQMGKHIIGVNSADITSQYPASSIYMKIPIGESEWFDEYDNTKYGYYHLKDVVFKNDSKLFKPVANSLDVSLDWASKTISNLYVDSEMMKYIINDIESYVVVKALLSDRFIKGEKIFGVYVNTLFEEKAQQDILKVNDEHNPAYREVIKLMLNSLTGKLVEDPNRYFSLEYSSFKSLQINGVSVEKIMNHGKKNYWITCGVQVYSYSKRLLFEYINCLPNKSDDVVHVETDSIYFHTSDWDHFKQKVEEYDNNTYPISIGSELGNIKLEYRTEKPSYFLGKKFKYLWDKKDRFTIKGIPQKTIDAHGNKVVLVDVQLYEDIYNGKTIVKEYATLTKNLYGKTCITSHRATRTINPLKGYKLFN